MRSRTLSILFLAAVAGAGIVAGIACGDSTESTFPTSLDSGVPTPQPTTTGFPVNDAATVEFPADPVIDGNAPPNSAAIFGAAQFAATGGPCLMEPEPGSMLPRNWLRPRFRWIKDVNGAEESLFELRIHSDKQKNDLVVYTTNPSWTMPRAMWDGLRTTAAGTSVTMTVRGGVLENGALTNASVGSSGPLAIAPVDAPGTIVYWTTASTAYFDSGTYDPRLKAFHVGDESVVDVLHPQQLPPRADGTVKCIGCHTSTPDGLYTVASTRTVSLGDGPTSIAFGLVDGGAGVPPYVSASAQTLLDRTYQATAAFSPAHFKPGDRVAVTMLRESTSDPFEMIWTDLETTSTDRGVGWDVFDRTGDSRYAAAPSISHDGSKIVYISTSTKNTSGNIVTNGELWTVPWNDRKGGAATPVPGANADGFMQYYPAFSPDDALIAFDRAPNGESTYNDKSGEIYVVPSTGATSATRLAANDPPACSGGKSPGAYNSWPKWSPEVGTDASGKKYYFIVFSSGRGNTLQTLAARLYVTPVVVDGPTITTYSALYLWNQPADEDNHSPTWDTLLIPDVK